MQLSPFEPLASTDIKIRTAEFLSILGANSFAIKLIKNIQLLTTEDYEVVAGIYFAANDYRTALEYFQKRIALMPDKETYEARLSRLSCADCLVQLDKFDQAINICHSLLKESKEALFVAICKQAMGEFLARAERTREAIKWINEARLSFPGKKESYDHALLDRWTGFTLAKLGKKNESRKYFSQSTKIIKKIGLREEIWLDNLKLEAELGLLNKKDSLRLHYYPGIPKSNNTLEKRPLVLGSENAKIKIDLASDEFVFKKDFYLGLPLELRLLGFLRIVESWGVGFELLKVLLWPEEPNSYLQLEGRLIQLVHRIKTIYKVNVEIKEKRIYLRSKSYMKIMVSMRGYNRLPSKLKTDFSAKDFRKMYNLKKTQSVHWLNKYLSEGRIQRVINGPQTFYRLTSISNE
ncbi:MAG: hypothetical protein AABY64_01495 [Bdellovibrionota bacterium]